MLERNKRDCRVVRATGCVVLLLGITAALADEPPEFRSPWRYELMIGLQSWPGLVEIEPLDGGSFDEVGFNFSAAAHYAVRTFEDSELLLGVDLGFMSNESSIALSFEDIMSRAMYVGPSMKWVFGRQHGFSLDAGIMYWIIDFAEIEAEYPYYSERVVWEDDAVGGYVGATWDKDAGDLSKQGGLTAGFKAHFVDFGDVTGGNPFLRRALGPAPGTLEGPIYEMQIGYRWR